jgi:hypothetical protein
MHLRPILVSILIAAFMGPLASAGAQNNAPPWRITGDLSEACTCSVPCTCNFGASPSPHSFCWALFSLDIKEGHYGDVRLNGLRLAGANGAKGIVVYIDERADAQQAAALRQIARATWLKALKANGVKDPKQAPPDYRLLGIKRARIEQVVGEKGSRLKIGEAGEFEADYIMGIDGKTPVVVENNWSWNIQHGIKGKTRTLRYHDSYGNKYEFTSTNSNQGRFDWSDQTPIYYR